MPFVKGQKPVNPGGLTPRQRALKHRLEGLTLKAVDALEKALDDESATHSERLAAAREVFDRAIGKAKQQTAISVEHNASPHLSALISLATSAVNQEQARIIDGQAIEIPRLLDVNVDIED
jgi:hypothetical protein